MYPRSWFSRRSNRMLILLSVLIGVGMGLLRALHAPDALYFLFCGSGNYLLGVYVTHLRLEEDGRLK
jgi:hypothetical protein